jgi:hypothetical protein
MLEIGTQRSPSDTQRPSGPASRSDLYPTAAPAPGQRVVAAAVFAHMHSARRQQAFPRHESVVPPDASHPAAGLIPIRSACGPGSVRVLLSLRGRRPSDRNGDLAVVPTELSAPRSALSEPRAERRARRRRTLAFSDDTEHPDSRGRRGGCRRRERADTARVCLLLVVPSGRELDIDAHLRQRIGLGLAAPRRPRMPIDGRGR